jgi:hypothetical protein
VRRQRLIVAAVMLASSVAVYAPFLGSMERVCRYWDGPPYLYVAKTLYNVPEDHPFRPYGLPPSYFANHLPLYPLLIRALTPLTLGSYPAAMLLATLITAVGAALAFHELLRAERLVAAPVWTAVLFCFLPPRWLVYHAVGATEPLFFCLVFGAFLALRRDRTGLVVLLAGLAALTRIVGVLLIPAFALIYLERGQRRRAGAMVLALAPLLGLFAWYGRVFGDVFAYFTWNLDAAGIVSPWPLEIYRRYAENSANRFHGLELFAAMYVAYGVGTLALWRRRRELAWFCLVYFLFCLFVTHHDLPRYMAVLAPFAILVAFDDVLCLPAVRLVLPLLLYLAYTEAWAVIPTKLVSAEVYRALLGAPGWP